MELNPIILALKEKAAEVDLNVPNLKWYLFGSILIKTKMANDIDLLVVYKNDNDARMVRFLLSEFSLYYPVDLMLLTEKEENEFQFVNEQKACNIFP